MTADHHDRELWERYFKPVRIQIYNYMYLQGESKKTDTFDIQMNNKGVSFF